MTDQNIVYEHGAGNPVRYRTRNSTESVHVAQSLALHHVRLDARPVEGGGYDFVVPPPLVPEVIPSAYRGAMPKMIFLSPGGSACREVNIMELPPVEVAVLCLSLTERFRHIEAVLPKFEKDLNALLTAIQRGEAIPDDFVVPDLWHPSCELPGEDGEIMRAAWCLAHDLAKAIWTLQDSTAVRYGSVFRHVNA